MSAPGADSYEAKYMDAGQSLARSRMRMPWWFFALLALPFLAVIGSSIATSEFVGLLGLPVIALVAVLFSHLRVTVTSQALIVQLGPFGPRIPIEAIEQCEVVRYDAREFGGWGIKVGNHGAIAYSVPGGDGRALRVTYRKGDKLKTAVITVDDAAGMAAAIAQARAGVRGGVRVAAEGGAQDPVAEAEAMANDLNASAEKHKSS